MSHKVPQAAADTRSDKHGEFSVAVWLFSVAALVFVMVIVGGVTRLTDSGLSITEWQPIIGAIPPLNEADWQAAFANYKLIPEYSQVNSGMTLEAFKAIFWWEWVHRFLGRFIGLAFAFPFAYFWFTGRLRPGLAPRLLGVLALGALQGLIGWYMVMSGLVDRIDVSQYRLALHLGVAFLIFGVLIWIALDLYAPVRAFGDRRASNLPTITGGMIVMLVFFQVVLGAFVAGTKAGLSYNTWPLMNGEVVPSEMGTLSPWYLNIFEDIAMVQFNHRLMAYVIVFLVIVNVGVAIAANRDKSLIVSAAVVLLAVIAQAALGIWTLLEAVPISLGIAHQGGAAIVFGLAVRHWQLSRRVE